MHNRNYLKIGAFIVGFLLAGSAVAVRIGAFTPSNETTAAPDAAARQGDTGPGMDREQALLAALGQPPVDLDLIRELADLRRDQALVAYDGGDTALAFDLLTNALAIDPLRPRDWETLGDWGMSLGGADGDAVAEYAFRQVIDLQADQPRVRLKIAALSSAHGLYPAAIEQIELALQSPRAEPMEWNHLVLLTQLYLRAQRSIQGMHFFKTQFQTSADDRYLLAEAVLLDALGEGQSAARIADTIAHRQQLLEGLRAYAQTLAKRFNAAGDTRLHGRTRAAQPWSATP